MRFFSGVLTTHQASLNLCNFVLHGDMLAGQYFSAVLRVRNVSAFFSLRCFEGGAARGVVRCSKRRKEGKISKLKNKRKEDEEEGEEEEVGPNKFLRIPREVWNFRGWNGRKLTACSRKQQTGRSHHSPSYSFQRLHRSDG